MRLKLIIAYKGTDFQGWQIQEKSCPPPTIQGALEEAVTKITGLKIRVHGSGRTDSGVHAHGQAAHLEIPDLCRAASCDWRKTLNALLPDTIRILQAEKAKPDFHARKDAIAKTYIYNFWTESAFMPPQLSDFVWNCGSLDSSLMRACLPVFEGEHDFTSFQNAGTEVESRVRRIFEIRLEEMPQQAFYPPHAPFLRLSISANGFLKQMARNIAGFLWKVGKSRLAGDSLKSILEAASRNCLEAPTAPAQGLALARVYYSLSEIPFELK